MNTTPELTRTPAPRLIVSIGLWLLQALLAAVFLAHGWLLLAPPPRLPP